MNLPSFILTVVTIGTIAQSSEEARTYLVKKIAEAPVISGKGHDPIWNTANELTDFQYPWQKGKPLPTRFRSLHTDESVYFLFNVTDPAPHVHRDKDHKMEVAASSRAEIFFRADNKMNPYYCLEIDPSGRVLDYEARHYRQFNTDWSWPENSLSVRSHRTKDGYSIELAISKASLAQLGLLKGNTLQAGLYRGDCSHEPGRDPEFSWISWIKPDSAAPDFHIPSSFGLLRLEE